MFGMKAGTSQEHDPLLGLCVSESLSRSSGVSKNLNSEDFTGALVRYFETITGRSVLSLKRVLPFGFDTLNLKSPCSLYWVRLFCSVTVCVFHRVWTRVFS